ncbi:restriction endonuclease subunit S [Siphonobacter curvatus]
MNAEEYKSFPIILPCIEEQTKIANFLFTIDEKIEKEHAWIK